MAVFFEPENSDQVDPDEMRTQWGLYNMSSLDILCMIPRRYFAIASIYKSTFSSKGIQDALTILVQAAVAKGGVELVVESMVSVVEAHTLSSPGILNQERLEDET